MKDVLLLGASGNIGNQVLDLLKDEIPYHLIGISIGRNINKGLEILTSFPSIKYFYSIEKLNNNIIQQFPNVAFYYGESGLEKLINDAPYDMMINALVGFSGLLPTILALEKDKTVCLANKESLVVGGEIINNVINNGNGKLIPIDSEHVAIDKCLLIDDKEVDALILTASGGAFRCLSRDELSMVTKEDALRHPTWNMGAKITIDCATMMNKCFEIIEAYYLFGNICDRIDILLHDESMIHSMVRYKDGMYRAEISKPDMHNPIRYAIKERDDIVTTHTASDYKKFGNYHFHAFDVKRYPLVRYAKKVIEEKGLCGCALNAANEECVNAFLNNEIAFLDIENIIDECMKCIPNVSNVNYEIIAKFDEEMRKKTRDLIGKLR